MVVLVTVKLARLAPVDGGGMYQAITPLILLLARVQVRPTDTE